MQKPVLESVCKSCLKADDLCICSEIKKLTTRYHVLILQHPQEPDKELGSARIAHLALPNSTLKVGLSWRNISSVLGKTTVHPKWAVLYLGSGAKNSGSNASKTGGSKAGHGTKNSDKKSPTLIFTDKNGVPHNSYDSRLIEEELEGIIVLDGTWSQAKTLWWRNPWLLKTKRAILNPAHKSLYGNLRKEPRKECLSTLESIAESLVALGEPETTGDELRTLFSKLLDRHRDVKKEKNKPPLKTQIDGRADRT